MKQNYYDAANILAKEKVIAALNFGNESTECGLIIFKYYLSALPTLPTVFLVLYVLIAGIEGGSFVLCYKLSTY